MNNRKVAVFVSRFPTYTETFIVNQVIFLLKQGYDITIFTTEIDHSISGYEDIDKYDLLSRTIELPTIGEGIPLSKWRRLILIFRIILRRWFVLVPKLILLLNPFNSEINLVKFGVSNVIIYDFIKKYHSDFQIVHAHFGVNGLLVSKLKFLGLFSQAKFITTFHGYDLTQSINGFYDFLFESNSLYTVNSKYSFSKLAQLIGATDRIFVIPMSLDTNKFDLDYKKQNRTDNCIKLLFVGRLIEFKGAIYAAYVLLNLLHQGYENVNLLIVGDGPERSSIEDLILTYPILTNHLLLLGKIPSPNVIELMKESDIFIFPGIVSDDGRAENQGVVLQEAQLMKLPIITTCVGGIPESVLDEKSGFIVQPKDLEALTLKCIDLIDNPYKRMQMGEEGQKFVIQKFSNEAIMPKFISLYLNHL